MRNYDVFLLFSRVELENECKSRSISYRSEGYPIPYFVNGTFENNEKGKNKK